MHSSTLKHISEMSNQVNPAQHLCKTLMEAMKKVAQDPHYTEQSFTIPNAEPYLSAAPADFLRVLDSLSVDLDYQITHKAAEANANLPFNHPLYDQQITISWE